jgi:Activator of Hsp90 ATPase homolog 1-like protein
MTADQQPSPNATRLERTDDAPAELIWELWTTAAGIEERWAPDGSKNRVSKLELRPGGQLVYTMTATAPKQVEFMDNAGLPLSTAASLPEAEESGHDARVAGAGVIQRRALDRQRGSFHAPAVARADDRL